MRFKSQPNSRRLQAGVMNDVRVSWLRQFLFERFSIAAQGIAGSRRTEGKKMLRCHQLPAR